MPTARVVKLLIALGLAAAVSACETPPPPPAPVAVVEPPPPPPPPPPEIIPPPPMALASQIIEDASTFRAYMGATSAISADFRNAEQVAEGVRIATGFEQNQLQQGAIAYAAIVALQEPEFVKVMREYAVDPEQRNEIVKQMIADPGYAATFPHADKAAGLVVAALDGMGAKVLVAGKQVKQAAYDVQRQPWSKTNVANAEGRLSDTKTRSGQRLRAALNDVEVLRKASLEGAAMSLSGQPVPPPYTATVVKGLAVAALAAMGEAGDEHLDRMAPLLTDEISGYCLNMSKLNLYQCLAVSKPQYEDIFCLGQHSMIDIGQCVVKAAGSPTPAYVEPPPLIPEPKAAPKPVTRTSSAKTPRRE